MSKRILHIEDEASTQVMIGGLLGDIAELVQVGSLDDANHALDSQAFDLVILDFTLPDGSGQSLLSRIKSLQPSTEVIVLSGHELTKNIPGVTKVLTKGRYKDEDLIELVRSILYDS